MKKTSMRFLFIISTLLCSTISLAQKISSQKGLTTAEFNTAAGAIKIYLPEDIRPGDMISGRIIAEPVGHNAKQIAKKMTELNSYSLSFNGQKFPVENANKIFECLVKSDQQASGVISLLNSAGNKVSEVSLPVTNQNSQRNFSTDCKVPSHALCGSPMRITGPFDGDLSNTKCTLDNTPLEVLAESPGQCILHMPDKKASGSDRFAMTENNKINCSANIVSVKMDLSTGKLNLLKGESTIVKVMITGLNDLKENAMLNINNRSSDIVLLDGGNEQSIQLTSQQLKGTAMYTREFAVHSIKTGSFSIDFDLQLPDGNPPVFADIKNAVGGKRDEGVLTAGTHTALGKGMQKWADANTEGKNPIDYQCENCFQCIKSVTFESNVSQIGSLGWGIITTFLSGGINFAGGILAKVKDIADKGGDIYKAIKELIDDGKIQVIGIKEQWCPGNEYCKVTGIIVYDVKTGCVEAIYKCTGTKMCCPFPETNYKLSYCLDKDGAVIDDTIKMEISH